MSIDKKQRRENQGSLWLGSKKLSYRWEGNNVENDKYHRCLRKIEEFGAVKCWDYKREQIRDM